MSKRSSGRTSKQVNPAGRLDIFAQRALGLMVERSGDVALQTVHGALEGQINGLIEEWVGPKTPQGQIGAALVQSLIRQHFGGTGYGPYSAGIGYADTQAVTHCESQRPIYMGDAQRVK